MDERSEKLKAIILQQYPSVRMFAQEVGIAHGTLVSALRNGIDGMAWGRLNQICQKLHVDPVTLEPIHQNEGTITEQERRILAYYNLLNDSGREKVEEYMKDMGQISVYLGANESGGRK